MPLSQEHVGSKIVAKIKIYILTRAELLLNLCYEIPCMCIFFFFSNFFMALASWWMAGLKSLKAASIYLDTLLL